MFLGLEKLEIKDLKIEGKGTVRLKFLWNLGILFGYIREMNEFLLNVADIRVNSVV